MYKQIILVLIVSIICSNAVELKEKIPISKEPTVKVAPPLPVWPNVWSAKYDSVFVSLNGTVTWVTTGAFYYDYAHRQMRIDYADSRAAFTCDSFAPLKRTYCSIVFNSQGIWVNFPAVDYCCHCCDPDHGCAPLKPDWILSSNGTFEGTAVIAGNECYRFAGWFGPSPNHFYARVSDGVPCELVNGRQQFHYYDPDTYSTSDIPQGVFALPPGCERNRCGKACDNLFA